MSERKIEELAAGDAFRDSLLEKADATDGAYPLWHGWALMDAFLAGIDWERRRALADKDTPHETEEKG